MDEIPVGPMVPAARAPVAKPEPAAVKSEPAPLGGPAPKPRWVKDALRDLVRMNPKKRVALAVAGTVVVAAVAINALLSGKNLEPATEAPALAVAPAPPAPRPTNEPASPPLLNLTGSAPAVTPESPSTIVPAIPVLPPPVVSPSTADPPRPLNLSGTGTVPPIELPKLPDPMAPPASPLNPPRVDIIPAPVIPASGADPDKPSPPVPAPPTSETAVPPIVLPPVVLPGQESRSGEAPSGTGSVPAIPLVTPPGSVTGRPADPPREVSPGPSTPPSNLIPPPGLPPDKPVTDRGVPTLPPPLVDLPPAALPPPGHSPQTDRGSGSTLPPAHLKLEPASGSPGGTLTLDKPAGVAGVAPTTRSSTPVRTDFDLDLHEPRAGETYATISQLHYGDRRYAEALQAFNQNRELGRGQAVEVPPLYILRRQYARGVGPPRTAEPTGSIRGVDWSPAPGRPAEPVTFEVHRDGMTMWDVAEQVLGDRRQWKQVADANPGLDPNSLPRGTRLRLPKR